MFTHNTTCACYTQTTCTHSNRTGPPHNPHSKCSLHTLNSAHKYSVPCVRNRRIPTNFIFAQTHPKNSSTATHKHIHESQNQVPAEQGMRRIDGRIYWENRASVALHRRVGEKREWNTFKVNYQLFNDGLRARQRLCSTFAGLLGCLAAGPLVSRHHARELCSLALRCASSRADDQLKSLKRIIGLRLIYCEHFHIGAIPNSTINVYGTYYDLCYRYAIVL